MNIRTVKSIINLTACKELVYSGGYCSEPIMTKDQDGRIIDNYFIFSRSDDFAFVEVPDVGFGIYSDEHAVAYINKDISKEFEYPSYQEAFDNMDSMRKASSIYEDIYEKVRDMFLANINRDESIINTYLEALKTISGNGLFGFYKRLYPSFFDWAKNNN